MGIHCQLLFSTILYLIVFCNTIVEFSTIINGKHLLGGYCYLFISSKEPAYPSISCNILIYICGGVALYAAVMAIYHGYGTYTASRENHIGRTMWVMPWLLVNAFLVILTFVCSCIYSVGLYITCYQVEKQTKISSCVYKVKEFRPIVIAEVSAWISVVLWISLVVVEGVRLRRNRRAVAREVYVEPTSSDTVRIGSILPTA